MLDNVYLPQLARIVDIEVEVEGINPIKTFKVEFSEGEGFTHRCGQCAMISVFGKGEAMFSIASPEGDSEHMTFSIIKMGKVTSALHDLRVGDTIGIRGPYGNHFPIEEWEGRDLFFFGGGCGLAPVWSVLHTVLARKEKYGEIALICGGRTADDILYNEEVDDLCNIIPVKKGVRAYFADQSVLPEDPSNAIGITCGPPVMIKAVINNLQKMGFPDNHIYTTIENKMKCGIGKCGRCNVGKDYLCTKGPVYSWEELKQLPQEY